MKVMFRISTTCSVTISDLLVNFVAGDAGERVHEVVGTKPRGDCEGDGGNKGSITMVFKQGILMLKYILQWVI